MIAVPPRLCGALLALGALAACSASSPDPAPSPQATVLADERPALALFTSLPIYWAEGDLGDLLSGDAPPHWARTALETRYALRPVDRLTDLPPGGLLLMAQPRALAGDENVALDDWVRAGGRLVLLADPMLDVHSAYGLGDRRRPEAITMLSPILTRWGLALSYDPDQPEGMRMARGPGLSVPVGDAGTLLPTGKGHESDCAILDGDSAGVGIIARCRIGEGMALVVADAEMLADGDHAADGAKAALFALLDAARTPENP